MKKYLIKESGNFYKANLHCHSTDSDGANSPEVVKEGYMKRGYSIVAFTDHDIMINKNYLSDDKFLALNGFETQSPGKGAGPGDKNTHFNYISLDKNNVKHPLYHSTDFKFWGDDIAAQVEHEEGVEDFERIRTPECMNEMIKRGRDKNFFVTYNHPMWNLDDYTDYVNLKGLNAMEICNTGSYEEGWDDFCPQIYDYMLRSGQRIYCLMTDDSHNFDYAFDGWTMIKADKLDYENVAQSLKDGQFYSSMGPEIYSLWIEDNEVHIKCSKARLITVGTARRTNSSVRASDENGITEASFKISSEDKYFRLTVFDYAGKPACTNAYFTDEFCE